MLRDKRKQFKQETISSLISNLPTSQAFWPEVKADTSKSPPEPTMDKKHWLLHFQRIMKGDLLTYPTC